MQNILFFKIFASKLLTFETEKQYYRNKLLFRKSKF